MTIIAIVSQKGGSGKTTLSVNLAAAAEVAGAIALIIDTDPQATASQWGAWRSDKAPEVIDSAPPRIQAKVDAAKAQGATFIVIDTPPHADSAASRAVEVADLVLIPCRPSAFDLAAIKTTVSLVRLFDKPVHVAFTAGPPHAPRMYEEAAELVQGFGIEACSKNHRPSLLAGRLECNKAHIGPSRRFGDRLCICRVVLLPFDERLHINRRDQPDVMAQVPNRTSPKMSAGTCLHRNNATRLLSQKLEQLRTCEFLAKQRTSL